MSDLTNFNSTFFLSLATMIFGFCAGALGYALKSKCSSVKCCCIEIIRDVELEADLEEFASNNTTKDVIPANNDPSFTPNESKQPSRTTSRRTSVIQEAVKQAVKKVNEDHVEEELNKRSFLSSMSKAV